MTKSDADVLKIADKVGLTASDVNTIQNAKKRRKLSNSSYLFVESIIGVSSFLIGYALVPIKVIDVDSNYPFGPTILFGNFSVLSELVKRKSLLRLITVTLFVFIVCFVFGNVVGQLFNFTSVPSEGSPVRYGVYSYD